LVNFIFGAYNAIEPFIDFYESIVQPAEQAIDDAVQVLDQALFNGLIGDIGKTADLISSTLVTYLAKLVTSGDDLFYRATGPPAGPQRIPKPAAGSMK
jgi:hypothetical protein